MINTIVINFENEINSLKMFHNSMEKQNNVKQEELIEKPHDKERFFYLYEYNKTTSIVPFYRNIVYIQLYTFFDLFLIDVIKEYYYIVEESLNSLYYLFEAKDILLCETRQEIVELIVNREIQKFWYNSIFDRFYKLMSFGFQFEQEHINFVLEFERIRNILIHSKGNIDDDFFYKDREWNKKCKCFEECYAKGIDTLKIRYKDIEKISLTSEMVEKTIMNVQFFINYIIKQFKEKGFNKNL